MSSNNKSDMSTSGSEGPIFPSGLRSSFPERSGNLRESIANRIHSSALGTTRSTGTSVHGDPVNFVQAIISDVKQVVPEKLPRPAETKRILGSFSGSMSDDLGPGRHAGVSKEEVKRTKSRLAESSNKANERRKTLDQAVSKIDKVLSNNPRKRSRGESSSDRPGGPSSGPGISRVGQQNHSSNADESEMGPPKEERTKNPGQNRRARTSITEMDARNIGASRTSGAVDKTRDISKINNRSTGEEKSQGFSNNSWQKARVKKRRSIIKTDASNSVGLARSADGDRERKQDAMPKHGGDARPKVMGPHTSRYGASSSAGVGSMKPDTEQGGLESPRTFSKGSQDGGASSINKRDRLGGFEIGNLKAINKMTDQEGSPTISRANASIRAPRSTHTALPKASGGMLRTDSDVWDQPSPGNKSGSSAGGSKRTKSTLSPSPPVNQWANQRPPKMSHVARRSNIVPVVGSQASEPMPDTLDNKTAVINSQGTYRIKKGDLAQSSSEESGFAVHKPKDNKRKRIVETEENNSLNSQRLGTAIHPLKKNKLLVDDDGGEAAVRKQGRGGRSFAPPRAGRPSSVEKPEAKSTTTKQRSARSGVDGRPGRPPVKKFSERRGKTRAREVTIDSPLDISGQVEDDREELTAAANAALAPGYASTDVLWKQSEPYFRYISDDDMNFLAKEAARLEQIHSTKLDEQDHSKKGNSSCFSPSSTPNGYASYSNGGKTGSAAWTKDAVEPILEKLVQGMDAGTGAAADTKSFTSFSICQKLMSAIISEEELERFEQSNGPDSSILCIEIEEGWLAHQESEGNQPRNGVKLDVLSVDCPYEEMSINDRILLELSQIGIYPDPCGHVPDLSVTDEDDILADTGMLEERLAKQALGMKVALMGVEQKAQAAKETQEREFCQLALDKLITKANEKYVASRGKHGSRAARQSAVGFINRSLARCKEFESNSANCFDELSYKELLLNSISKRSDPTQNEEKSPQDLLLDKDEQWSTGVKKKELLLDDVVGNITGSVALGSGTKGKRSERDARGSNKNSRGSSSNPKGDRKPKAKPKQRSTSTNTLPSNSTAELAPRSNKREGLPPLPTKPGLKQIGKESEEELEPIANLSGLPIPDLDLVGDSGGNGYLDLVGDTGGDGTDFWSDVNGVELGGWDCDGLDIPMDNLADIF